MKKFFIYFLIIFAITFSFVNSRFVSAEFKFWLDGGDEHLAQTREVEQQKEKTNLFDLLKKPAAKAAATTGNFTAPYSLEIPILNINAPIVMEISMDSNVILNRLQDGVVHYASTPALGQKGTAVILGHSSAYPWYKGKYGSVFALLGKLKVGDIIYVNGGNATLAYKVSGTLVFHPLSNDKRIQELEQTDTSSIVLVSCWPVGTNFKRIAIKADLIQ